MVKNTAKREKSRAWTPSTFTSDGHGQGHSSPLQAISEHAMDEDLIDTTPIAPGITIIHSALSTDNNNNNNSNNNKSHSGDINGSSGESDDHKDDGDDEDEDDVDSHGNDDNDDDDDRDDNRHDSEDDSSSSSQDHETSDDSDESIDANSDESVLRRLSQRIDAPKRNRSGSIGNKAKKVAVGLSTSSSNSSSKIVSATPNKKITKKSKVSVKPKSSKGSLSSAAARQATEDAKLEAAKPIVSRFLELENTKLNDKLLQVFMINGMLPFVIECITRLDPEIAKELNEDMDGDETNQESKFMTRLKYSRRKRDYADINVMKKSYTTMNFLTRSDVYNEFILSSGHQVIVKELFKIFRPESNGNFYHFQKVFETILKKFRSHTMLTLFEDVDPATGQAKTPLVLEMLPFLDQAPVALSMIKVLFPAYTYGFAERVQDFYRVLQRGHFMEMLLTMVTLADDPTPSMGDFVVSLLDEATRAKDAKIFFSCLRDDPIWAERLVQGVLSDSPVRRHSCIEIIYSILVRSIQLPFQDMFANSIYITEKSYDRVDSYLEQIANGFSKHLDAHIPSLCNTFVGSKNAGEVVELPGYTVPKSFTVARLWLLDSIYHCLNDVKDNPSLLESIPASFWSTLVDSFIQFRFNNAFHVHFYKMFRVVLYSEQASVYDQFFIQTDFIKRLIEHYLDAEEPTGSRGYIILILNCLRLLADVEQRAAETKDENAMEEEVEEGRISETYWTDILRDHAVWKEFAPTLRHATLKQTRDTLCNMDPNLRFQFAPLQSRHSTESPMTKRHIGIPGVSARGTEGIDLGSQYGNSLGFGVPMKYDPAADEEELEKQEQQKELEVQKALANMMPSVDWKLIPPQRVLDAMRVANAASKAAGSRHKSAANASSETNGTKAGEGASSVGNTTGTEGTTTEGTTTKSKKKKKNKKKRPSSSAAAGDTSGDDDEAGHSDSSTSSTNGSISSDMSSEDSSDGGHEKDSGTEGDDTSEDESRQKDESDSNSTTGVTETEEELLKRRREKKRERKRKNKMNKKNRFANESSQADASGDAMDLWG
ncbi:hypothetical protein KI688_002809 [Linnemannia hyalina]|uniref:Uncharacterized protein n=1 Tax=Linnemannia hyalina TaxID=64524 RepID=A0A9P7XP06_9FUNG|nr:hypothetical protein KI688_002809 [Linnemannia hyalina]